MREALLVAFLDRLPRPVRGRPGREPDLVDAISGPSAHFRPAKEAGTAADPQPRRPGEPRAAIRFGARASQASYTTSASSSRSSLRSASPGAAPRGARRSAAW